MELLNPSVSNRPRIVPRFSSTRKFSIRIPSKFYKNPYLPFHLFFSTRRIVHVSAHFGRPTNRRNSLRKKLIHDQQCIELCTTQNGEQKIGFYSLEMAADLELEPKPCHVIAFEDAGDCKNLCCIIQTHMDMLGNGHAFVVPRPPKDAFREAKANGFGVTVIRKKELQLNVDQTLEEVEEQITETGSKMYHDKLMRERFC